MRLIKCSSLYNGSTKSLTAESKDALSTNDNKEEFDREYLAQRRKLKQTEGGPGNASAAVIPLHD